MERGDASGSVDLRPISVTPRHGWAEQTRRALQYNSGRIIALTRVLLAAVFLWAVWVDPAQPVRAAASGYALVLGYLLWSVGLLGLTWRSWWLDHRLAWAAMVLDVAAFLSAVFFTEGVDSDFTSPFLAFFAFLMLAATIRWDWRATMATGLAVTILYLLVGLWFADLDLEFDIYRFARRVSYMIVLTLVLAWFGLQRREPSVGRFVELPDPPRGERTLLDQALRYAADQVGARCAAIAWADHEEPHVELRSLGLALPKPRLGPDTFDSDTAFGSQVCLFDRPRGRALVPGRGRRPMMWRRPIRHRLAEYCCIDEGLSLPLNGVTGRGELLLSGIGSASADLVQVGAVLSREITAGFDRQATLALAGESALARIRDSLARDLHDSVSQSLAGALLRLEGLRGWIRAGGDPEPEIEAMKHSLRGEQRHVRSLIARLRLGVASENKIDAANAARTLLTSLSAQWSVGVRLVPPSAPIALPGWFAHEMGQVLREAVANAVRHGNARQITVGLGGSDGELTLTIEDDGKGFDQAKPGAQPWSISQRIERLGGRLTVFTGNDGTSLRIQLPAAVAA